MTEEYNKLKKILKVRGCSDLTAKSYISSIKRFIKYFNGKDIKNLSEEEILDYLIENFMANEMQPATFNVNRAAIIYYYSIIHNRMLNKALLPYSKVSKKYHSIISKKDIIKLLRNADIRLQLMIVLAFGCGLRRAEVASLNIKNIDLNNQKIKITGKGNKQRYTILPNFVIKILKPYYLKNKAKILKAGGYLFPKGNIDSEIPYIHPSTVGQLFHCLLKKLNCNNDDITFHTLRRSFATLYIKNGGDIWILKDLLGHSSINSTLIYVQMARNYSDVIVPLNEDIK